MVLIGRRPWARHSALKDAGYEIRKVEKGGPAMTDTVTQAQAARAGEPPSPA